MSDPTDWSFDVTKDSKISVDVGEAAGRDRRKEAAQRRLIDHTGDRFGRLVVIERSENRFRQVTWLCQCDCGGTNIVPGTQLRRGQVRSCGCICRGGPHGKIVRGHNGSHPRPPGSVALAGLLSTYQSNAKTRNLEWRLPRDRFEMLVQTNCDYCGGEPKSKRKDGANGYFLYGGIDRADSRVGYTPENSVPCCRECNLTKGSKTAEQFREWVLRIAVRYHGRVCGAAIAPPSLRPSGAVS